MFYDFLVSNWMIIMLIAIATLNIIAIIAMVFARRAIDKVASSRASRLDIVFDKIHASVWSRA